MVAVVIEDALIAPSKLAVTRAPTATSTAVFAGEVAVTVGGVVSGGGGTVVVKVQIVSVASGLPTASVTPEAPPLIVATYVVEVLRSALGSSVAVRLTAS